MIITRAEFDMVRAHTGEEAFTIPVDFGLGSAKVVVIDNAALLAGVYPLKLTEKIKPRVSYLLTRKGPLALSYFCEEARRFYKLMPTKDWPTVTIGSCPMHKVSRLSPREDTARKISFLKPYGVVLDTCMGLGYTAVCAAEKSRSVYTFEKDPVIYKLARLNPVSQKLFSEKKITITRGDITVQIKRLSERYFDCIIHDPPTFSLAPSLYTVAFYGELLRVLKSGGRLFHYTPRWGVRRGIDFPSRVKRKLQQAGFSKFAVDADKGGIVCGR